MPRRKPDGKSVIVHRYELGDFERRQLEDAKVAYAVRSMALPLGLGAAGLAIGAGLLFAAKELEELQDWFSDNWKSGFGSKTDPSEINDAVGDTPAKETFTASLYAVEGAPDFSGMSPFGIYNALWECRTDVMEWAFRAYCEATGATQTANNYYPFVNHLKTLNPWTAFYQPYTRFTNAAASDAISPFAYQLAIREVAARRAEGFTAGVTIGSVIAAPLGLVFGATQWALRGLGFMVENDWSGTDVRDAPGYVQDPFLETAWGRTDFPGWIQSVSSSVIQLGLSSGYAAEERLLEAYVAIQGPDEMTAEKKAELMALFMEGAPIPVQLE